MLDENLVFHKTEAGAREIGGADRSVSSKLPSSSRPETRSAMSRR